MTIGAQRKVSQGGQGVLVVTVLFFLVSLVFIWVPNKLRLYRLKKKCLQTIYIFWLCPSSGHTTPPPPSNSEGAGCHNFLHFLSMRKIIKLCVIIKPPHDKKLNCPTIWMVILVF